MTDDYMQSKGKKDDGSRGENIGVAERQLSADDMKKYKNCYDAARSYISGDEDKSSSGHRFSQLNNRQNDI